MKWLFPVVLLFAFGLHAQKPLPKKFRKTYTGTIPSYYIHGGEELIKVREASIEISFTKTDVTVQVGGKTYKGTYSAIRKKKVFSIRTEMETMHINETLEINRKEKSILRKGISPQPNALLQLKRN